jgi:uncharacterized membrane protein
MQAQRINRMSQWAIVALSFLALFMVMTGYFQPPQTDEGSAAHIFQMAIVLLVPTLLLFLATADWRQPGRSARPLALPASALVIAFAALYYLEHFRY